MNTCCHVPSRHRDEAELRTPLHWAAMVGDVRLVCLLLDKGADTSRLSTGTGAYPCADVTPLIAGFQVMYARHDHDYKTYDTAAFYRLLDSATPEMINVRIREDSGCYGGKDAASPLAAACDMLELNLVNALLAKGADPNFPATSKCGIPGLYSPLTLAVKSYVFPRESQDQRAKRQKENAKRIEIAKALLAAGADVNLYKNLLSSVKGNAPLRELLIEFGALSVGPVTWSDDKSRAKITSHGNRVFPSTEDLTGILQQQSLVELHLYDGSESMFQEVPGTSESVKKLTCSFGGGNGDIGDVEETALPLLSKFPRLEELTWNYAHESINEHQMLQLARVTPNLRVLRLHGDRDGPEGSRRIYVSDDVVARLSAALPLQSLWVGSSSFLTRASEPVDNADDDYDDWEPGSGWLSPKALEAMARHCPSLESVCLDSYEVDCFYNERETGSFEENQMPEKTVTIQLAPLRCLRHLALRLLLTDDNVASIAKAAPNLSTLALVSPLLTDAALAAVATCSELEALSFSGRCNVSDAGVVQLAGGCPRLQKVEIQCSRKLTALSIIALAKLPVLRILYLTGAKEGFATAAACDSLRAGCVQLECLYLEGFRRMGADAMEALSQCTALRVLKLRGELSREDLARICAAFSSGFGALRTWSYSAPHRFAKSLIRRSGLELLSWEHVDRDMTPEHDARARVRLLRPDVEVSGSMLTGAGEYCVVDKYRRRFTAIDAAREAYLNAFAMKKGLFDVARSYGSDDDDEDEGRGEEVSPVSVTDMQGSVAPAEELRKCTQCEKDLVKVAFSNKQWNHVNRRCKSCILAEQAAAAASPKRVHGEGMQMGEHNVHEEDGAEICTCKAHGLEICHLCCVDFKDINDMQREDSRLADADSCAGPGCTNRGKGMKYCARCGRVKYCGEKCQKAHWRAGHKQACQALGARGGESSEQGFRPRIIKASCSSRTFEELAPGTRVRLPDRSGRQPPEPLVGKILQTKMKGREEITGMVLPTYIIRYENGERDSIPVEDVHGEWEVVKESPLTSSAGHKQAGMGERGDKGGGGPRPGPVDAD